MPVASMIHAIEGERLRVTLPHQGCNRGPLFRIRGSVFSWMVHFYRKGFEISSFFEMGPGLDSGPFWGVEAMPIKDAERRMDVQDTHGDCRRRC